MPSGFLLFENPTISADVSGDRAASTANQTMDPIENTADVTEVPANTDDTGVSTEEQPGTSSEGEAESNPTGFRNLFQQARSAIAGDEADGSGEEDDSDEDTEADDDIPADKDGESDDDPNAEGNKDADPDKAEDEADQETGKKTARSQAFKDIQAENERLKTESEATTTRLDTLEQTLEKHGGIDAVETALTIFDKIASGKAVEIIDDLPPHERAKVAEAVFNQAISNPSKRVEGVNAVFKADFGLEKDLPQPLMEKLFEFATSRINFDADDFEAYLDRELELIETPETQLEKANREIDRLKNPDAKAAEDAAPPTDFELSVKANDIYNQFEAETYKAVAEPLLKDYGLDVKSTDSAVIKAAKEALVRALDDHVGVEIRKSKAFEPLLPYWLSGDDKYQANPFYTQGVSAYKRAMKAKVEPVLKSLSVLFGNSTTVETKPAGEGVGSGGQQPAQPKLPAPGGRSSIPVPQKAKGEQKGGFRSAFAQAKKAAGNI